MLRRLFSISEQKRPTKIAKTVEHVEQLWNALEGKPGSALLLQPFARK
jgi:hypothetical protein